jgi:hypothetical protein
LLSILKIRFAPIVSNTSWDCCPDGVIVNHREGEDKGGKSRAGMFAGGRKAGAMRAMRAVRAMKPMRAMKGDERR